MVRIPLEIKANFLKCLVQVLCQYMAQDQHSEAIVNLYTNKYCTLQGARTIKAGVEIVNPGTSFIQNRHIMDFYRVSGKNMFA